MWEKYVKDSIGKKLASKIKKSDILRFYALRKEQGMDNGIIQIFHKMIHPSLQIAVEDHIIRGNPSDGCCKNYSGQGKVKRALTVKETEIFMECVQNYRTNQKLDLLFRVMLGTGCRIGEIADLRGRTSICRSVPLL